MDFKKLFRKDDKAVSPVIGVILMVAITVILAAAIGSSVFSKGTAESAPQANFDIKSAGIDTTSHVASIKIEHLGGEAVNLTTGKTKVMASVNGDTSQQVSPGAIDTLGVGDVQTLKLMLNSNSANPLTDDNSTDYITSGDTINIKFVDVATNQLICDKDVRF